MKYIIEKETKELYYIHIRWGDLWKWGSQKTFVRVPYEKKDGTLGSKFYCSAKETALLFESKQAAAQFESDYKTYGSDIKSLRLPDGARLRELTVNGHNCLQVVSL